MADAVLGRLTNRIASSISHNDPCLIDAIDKRLHLLKIHLPIALGPALAYAGGEASPRAFEKNSSRS